MTSARQVKVSVQVQPHHQTYDEMRAAWRRAEALGVDAIFNWDHFSPRFGDPDGNIYECWTALASMAECTDEVMIGPLITVDAFRNPNLLADMARTVDIISGGRLILGLGAGGWDRDFADAGVELKSGRKRLEEMERHIPIIRDRMAAKNPPPLRGAIPILVGGNGEKVTLRIVAAHADIWNGQGDPEDIGHLNRVLDDWCAKLGRDPREIERSALLIRPHQAERADEYLEAGITHLVYSLRAPGNDFSPVESLLEWRAGLVKP
ncbi:MAG: LLM class F420-dependent oxidoreductase [Chloroflexota bacterium]